MRIPHRFIRFTSAHIPSPGNTLIAATALTLAACGAGERTDAGRTALVRDSAGITIVENSSPVWTEETRWRVAPEPDLEIGVLDGEEAYQLDNVRGLATLSDGRIVLANAGSAELRYYDSAGQHLQTVGRRGSGPGEFQHPGTPYRLAGDSVLVGVDPPGRILALFDPEGNFVRSYGGVGRHALGSVVGVLDAESVGGDTGDINGDGSILRQGLSPEAMTREEGQDRDPEVLVRHARDGTPLDTVAYLPGGETYRATEQSGSMVMVMVNPTPFAHRQHAALHGELAYVGAGDSYEIEVYRISEVADQVPERLIRLDRPNRPVASREVSAFRRAQLDRELDDNTRRRVERYLADVEFPKEMPAYRDIRVDREGYLWVEEYRAHGDEGAPRWEVFDPEGTWLGMVETPEGLQIQEIGGEYLLGVWTDELGVQYVRRYRLMR